MVKGKNGMTVKTVMDEYGKEVLIDEDTRRLYDYSNKDRVIVYTAGILEDDGHGNLAGTGFSAAYTERGTVDDIEERLQAWNNKVMLLYASFVKYNADKYDPDRAVYRRVLDYVKENPDRIFTKRGDFRKVFLVNRNELKNLLPATAEYSRLLHA